MAKKADMPTLEQIITEMWAMQRLVDLARRHLGPIAEQRAYCFKVPPAIGGDYDESNLASLTLAELIAVTGNVAFQIRDLPAGTRVELKTVQGTAAIHSRLETGTLADGCRLIEKQHSETLIQRQSDWFIRQRGS